MKALLNPWLLIGILVALGAATALGFYQGTKAGKQSRQAEINALVAQYNQKQEDARASVASINQKLQDKEAELLKAQAALEDAAQNVKVEWKTKIVPGQCGVSQATTSMVRTIMDMQVKK